MAVEQNAGCWPPATCLIVAETRRSSIKDEERPDLHLAPTKIVLAAVDSLRHGADAVAMVGWFRATEAAWNCWSMVKMSGDDRTGKGCQ
jgi:hypothetical protein